MPIRFNCPNCAKRLKVPDSAGGRRGRCTRCGAAVVAPSVKVEIPDASSVRILCTSCGAKLTALAALIGQDVTCPNCGANVVVSAPVAQGAGQAAVAAAPPPPDLTEWATLTETPTLPVVGRRTTRPTNEGYGCGPAVFFAGMVITVVLAVVWMIDRANRHDRAMGEWLFGKFLTEALIGPETSWFPLVAVVVGIGLFLTLIYVVSQSRK